MESKGIEYVSLKLSGFFFIVGQVGEGIFLSFLFLFSGTA